MSLEKTLHPDEKYKAGKMGSSVSTVGLAIAFVFLGISIVLELFSGTDSDHPWKRFLYAYVVGWTFIFSICIGCLWIVLLHHLCRGRWLTAVRRIAEAIAGAFPLVFVAGLGFIIPLLAGYKNLYYWAHPDAHNPEINATMLHKLGWLEPGFFTVRYVIYGVVFSAIAAYFAKKSREQDDAPSKEASLKMSDTLRIASGPAMVAFSIITCLAAFDILMSLAPKWYSTIYRRQLLG